MDIKKMGYTVLIIQYSPLPLLLLIIIILCIIRSRVLWLLTNYTVAEPIGSTLLIPQPANGHNPEPCISTFVTTQLPRIQLNVSLLGLPSGCFLRSFLTKIPYKIFSPYLSKIKSPSTPPIRLHGMVLS